MATTTLQKPTADARLIELAEPLFDGTTHLWLTPRAEENS